MQIQTLHTAHKSGWTPAYDWWADQQIDHTNSFTSCALWIQSVPVMPATVLGLELLLQDRSLHLQMAADLILKDIGATLQILRLTQREMPLAAERPARFVDCLAALDTAVWFGALSANAVPFSKSTKETAALWKHCRSVAHYARLIAESLGEISPEEAYLAGLLHDVENLVTVLGKQSTSFSNESVKLNEILPGQVMAALSSAKQRGSHSVWRYVLASAHALATSASSSDRRRLQTVAKPFVV